MQRLLTITLAMVLVLSVATAAMAVDKSPIQPLKEVEKEVRAPQMTVKANLDCSGATTVMLDNTYTGDTNTGVNNVSAYSCSFYDESGPELVYVLNLTEPSMFTINLIPEAGVDLDLAVLSSCDEDLGCEIVADTGVVTNSPVSGTIYLVVDGYNGAAGSFTLELIQDPLPEPVDACAEVIQPLPGEEGDIVPDGTYAFSGDTCGSTNHIEFLDCADYSEAGLDNFYEFTMLPGATIDVTVTSTADGALWILDACAEPFTCLGYGDATLGGEPETVSYTNDTGAQQRVFLVVDSWGADTCGTFTGDITVNGGVVGLELPSWGEVKARF